MTTPTIESIDEDGFTMRPHQERPTTPTIEEMQKVLAEEYIYPRPGNAADWKRLGKCARPGCEETEWRINGYCSVYCEDVDEANMDKAALKNVLASALEQLEAANRDARRLDFLESEMQREMLTPSGYIAGPIALFRRNMLITRLRIDEVMAEVAATHNAALPPVPESPPLIHPLSAVLPPAPEVT